MTPPTLHCPKCNHPLSVHAAPGQLLQCPNCHATFPAPRTAQQGVAPSPGDTAPSPRPVTVPMTNYTPPAYRSANRFSGIALTALVFAVIYFLPLGILLIAFSFILIYALPALALITIMLGVLAIVKTSRRTVRGRAIAITALTIGCLELVFAGLVIPFAHRSAEEAERRIRCASHLRALGFALMLYSNEHRGALPDRLEDLPLSEQVTGDEFICPSSTETPAGGTGKQLAASLQLPGHQSYIYLGKGRTYYQGYDAVLIYESLGHHGNRFGEGFNVLLNDGSAIYLHGPMARKISAELQSGMNPPPSLRAAIP
jgi:hypothetical protein